MANQYKTDNELINEELRPCPRCGFMNTASASYCVKCLRDLNCHCPIKEIFKADRIIG